MVAGAVNVVAGGVVMNEFVFGAVNMLVVWEVKVVGGVGAGNADRELF